MDNLEKTIKRCNVCGTNKLLTDFYQKYVGGAESTCKNCKNTATKERHRIIRTSWVGRNPYLLKARKKCSVCKKNRLSTLFYKSSQNLDGLYNECKSCSKERDRNRYPGRRDNRLLQSRHSYSSEKEECISHYGVKCYCCSESNLIFLTIDHINGGGNKHRKEIGTRLYRWLIKNNFPNGFQVSCMNCNWGKYLNKGVCPH